MIPLAQQQISLTFGLRVSAQERYRVPLRNRDLSGGERGIQEILQVGVTISKISLLSLISLKELRLQQNGIHTTRNLMPVR